MPLRRNPVSAILLIAFLCLSGCAPSSQHRDPDTLVALIAVDAAQINPLYIQTVQDNIFNGFVFDSLTYSDQQFVPRPWLAQSWTHTPDGLNWTVNLRHDVKWSDGVPFTADDVVYSYQTMLDPKVGFNGAGDIDYIKKVSAEGPYRVHFTLSNVSALFESSGMALYIFPKHILGKTPPDRQRFSDFGEHPIGTGPYMLANWRHDSEVVFERNPHWWHGTPKIKRLDFRVLFNPQAQIEALRTGSADLIDDLNYTGYLALQKVPHAKTMTFDSLYVDTYEVNLRRPGLSELPVRQAMQYARNRQAVIDGFFGGHGVPATSIIPLALTRWYNPHTKTYPYDPAKARELLDRAGWRPGPDGIREKAGKRLSVEILVNQGSSLILDELQVMQAEFRAVGIDLAIRQLDFPSLVQRTYAGKYDLIADSRGGTTDPDYYSVLHSSQVPPAGSNTTHFHDPVVDRVLTLGKRELNFEKRRGYYNIMQERLAEELPMLWDVTRFSSTGYSDRLKLDPKTTLQSPLIWYNVFDWELGP